MSYRPTGRNVLIERIAAQKATASGIILKSAEEPDKAKILAIGPEIDEVAVNEVAVVNWNAATKVQDELYIINIDHVVLVLEDYEI
jgi:co-chaperonin GroES (HSP10)